jgi:uncharacterized membrane protein YkoI
MFVLLFKTTIMKRLFLTGTLALSLAACSSAQKTKKENSNSKIPAAVTAAFKQHYPTIKQVKWEKEGLNYEASFENNQTETSVVIDSNGKIWETETEIETTSLPKAALDYIQTHYKNGKVKEAAKLVQADGSINYEAEVTKKDLIFDANGLFIKEITE